MLYFKVDGFFCHRTSLDGGDKIVGVHETSFRHFKVKSRIGGADGGIYGSPVRHQDAFETPEITQNVNIKPFMFSSMDTVQKIVAVHYGAYIGFLYGFSEGGEIDFM